MIVCPKKNVWLCLQATNCFRFFLDNRSISGICEFQTSCMWKLKVSTGDAWKSSLASYKQSPHPTKVIIIWNPNPVQFWFCPIPHAMHCTAYTAFHRVSYSSSNKCNINDITASVIAHNLSPRTLLLDRRRFASPA